MLTQEDYWMVNELRQQGVTGAILPSALGCIPERPVSGQYRGGSPTGRRGARPSVPTSHPPKPHPIPLVPPAAGLGVRKMVTWGHGHHIVHIVARNCHLLPPWYREDKELDAMESRFSMQRMRFRPLAPTLSQQEGGMP